MMNIVIESISNITRLISYGIGILGVMIIVIGVIQTTWLYCTQHTTVYFGKLRLILNTHMILGLDFFIGKDIIDTFLMHADIMNWEDLARDLATLVTIIIIRVVLSHFLEKEIQNIKQEETQAVLDSHTQIKTKTNNFE